MGICLVVIHVYSDEELYNKSLVDTAIDVMKLHKPSVEVWKLTEGDSLPTSYKRVYN